MHCTAYTYDSINKLNESSKGILTLINELNSMIASTNGFKLNCN